MALLAENDHLAAVGARCRLVFRRVRELLEIELVGAVPDVHLRLEFLPALGTVFPIAIVAFHVVEAAKSVTPVVASTTVLGIREHHVVVFVIADPGIAALGFGQVLGLAA